jgi:hypothetical protein
MALFLLKLFAGRDPALLPVTQNLSIRHQRDYPIITVTCPDHCRSPVPFSRHQETGRRAVADRMPPSVDDYMLDHTESAWPVPVVVPVVVPMPAEVR